MHSQINYGYPWWLSYGHLVIALLAIAVFLVAWRLRWHWIFRAVIGVVAVWALSAFLAVHFLFDVNRPGTLPTAAFLQSGTGRVLDLGAGTGRSSIMVLEERPQCTLVAFDEFGRSYEMHFGGSGTGQQKLLENLRLAGVDSRAEIRQGDMRQLPFEPSSFDAVITAYAIDHLGAKGRKETLAEASRVLKPNGEFLMMVVYKDPVLLYTFGPLLVHMRGGNAEYWDKMLNEAGFDVVENGVKPGTLYVLARKR